MTREEILGLEVRPGTKVGDIRMLNGHNLVLKIQMAETCGRIILPPTHRRKSIANMVSVKGLVITNSAPYYPLLVRTTYEYSEAFGDKIPKHETYSCNKEVPSSITPGSYVLYNAYNMGKLPVSGLDEPLVMVRDCDILAEWDAKYEKYVELADFAMTRQGLQNDV